MRIRGRLVDLFENKIVESELLIEAGRISEIRPATAGAGDLKNASVQTDRVGASDADMVGGSRPGSSPLPYILPGFIDAHVHIESSLLIPSEFARLAVVHGTIGTISDPHEIANVCGLPGVEFMIADGQTVPFYFHFGAPSCVPATSFETAGASLDASVVGELLKRPGIKYLSEMMNFPGVLHKDPEVMKKIAAAHALGKPVDGHAPGLRGEAAKQYIDAGISTDHECFTAEEALDKLRFGMQILIREGSAAKNFEALADLLNDHSDRMMFCSDDKHADSLVAGHIDRLCARAVARGIDPFKVLHAACLNPVRHYGLESGLLRVGDPADLILVEDLRDFKVLKTYIRGELVAAHGVSNIVAPSRGAAPATHRPDASTPEPINAFHITARTPAEFAYPKPAEFASGKPAALASRTAELAIRAPSKEGTQIPVIEALDGQLITNKLMIPVGEFQPAGALLHANPANDLLKLAVVNRYRQAPVALAFIRHFGLRRGALASSVAHDSHNIVAVGADDESLCRAVNLIIGAKGGLSAVDGGNESILPLPVAGLMSQEDGYAVAREYIALDAMVKGMGSTLGSPFMTLSFMALLVIPHLKLSDMGLFDGDAFAFV